MQTKKIGWIGTGLMGKPMAGHLVKAGYQLNIYSRTKSKAKELIDLGCTWYNSPREVCENSDIIFTIIGYPKDVDTVYFGEDGLFKATCHNKVFVDMTTTQPSLAVRIFEMAKKNGATSIDAPVSGGEQGAINGALSIMIGGEKEVAQSLSSLFETFGKNMVYQGVAGAGQHTKMCNQITVAGTMIGVCESLVYGIKAGLDLNTVLASIGKGAAGCWSLDVMAPKIISNDFEPGFMVKHFVKDLEIALQEAETMRLSLPGLALAKQLYMALMASGNGEKGTQALVKVIAQLSHVV